MEQTQQAITAVTPTGTQYTATFVDDTALRFRCEVPAKGVSFVAHYDERQDALMSCDPVPGFGRRVGLKLNEAARKWIAPFVAAEKAREEERQRKIREEIKEEERRRVEPFIARARETGARVEVRRYSTGCNDRREECSLDIVTEWALPDGTIETARMHTW